MNILIVSRGYPNATYPLNGIFELDQAKALAQRGHNVTVLAIDLRSIRRKRKLGYERNAVGKVNIECLNIPCGRIPGRLLCAIGIQGIRQVYKKIVSSGFEPEIVHSHFLDISYMTKKALKDKNIPIVVTEHLSSMVTGEITPWQEHMAKSLYNNVDGVITVGKGLERVLKEKYEIVAKTIPNIVDETFFGIQKKSEEEQKYRFVTVGSLQKRKNMELLVRAFKKVFSEEKGVELYVIGEGPQRELLQTLINDLGLQQQVQLLGLLNRDQILGIFKKSDCFVLASNGETFGVVYIEALATGLPVIATRCGGPEDFVHNENGILIDKNDEKALIEALTKMKRDSRITYDSEAISNEMKLKYSGASIAVQLEKYYQKIIKRSISK